MKSRDPLTEAQMQNRRNQLQRWIDERYTGVKAAFIASTNDGETQINQGEVSALLQDKAFGERRARSLEKQAGMPPGYLDKNETDRGTKLPASSPENQWPFSFHLLTRYQTLMTALPKRKALQASRDIESLVDVAVSKWERVAASEQAPEVSGIAGDVLARKLTTKTRDFAPAPKKPA